MRNGVRVLGSDRGQLSVMASMPVKCQGERDLSIGAERDRAASPDQAS